MLERRLAPLRAVGDPPLDEALADGASAARWLQGQALPAAIPRDLPRWTEPARLTRACGLFRTHAVPLAMLLGSASLLECFACAQGAQALYAARTLPRAPRSRIGRTGRFVLDVLTPEAWHSGAALHTLTRIRILHATTRHRLRPLALPPGEVPLCQEDQLGTLMAFGLSPMLHLRHLGVSVSTEAVEDMLHLWRVAGHLLGAPEAHLPTREEDALGLAAAIRTRCFGPSAEGRALTAAVLETYARVSGSATLHHGFLRWLRAVVGEATCDLLGVDCPPAGRTGQLLCRGSGAAWLAWGRLLQLPGASQLSQVALLALRRHADLMAQEPMPTSTTAA